jgi:RNA ligase (TIGR02306 family)
MPVYDIEGMRKYANVIEPGTEVVITEKVHGSNARFVFLDGKLYCGSRNHFRTDSIWNRMAEKYKLRDFLAANEGIAIYGEIYGRGVQDLTYGADDHRMVFFDAYDTRNGKWLPWDQFRSVCEYQGLPLVPILYRGPYSAGDAALLAEGPTVLGNGVHVREGIVVKPTREAWNETIGRVFLKLPGEGYLTRKEKKS